MQPNHPPPPQATPPAKARLANIEHWIVIYQENWSFDGLYGKFPGPTA